MEIRKQTFLNKYQLVKILNAEAPMNQPSESKHLNLRSLTTDLLEKWVKNARLAPSGGNARPWEVIVKRDGPPSLEMSIRSSYINSRSPMDLDLSSSVVALGCLAKTLQSLAALDGYDAQYSISNPRNDLETGQVYIQFFYRDLIHPDYSLDTLEKRRTCRTPLSTEPLNKSERDSFYSISEIYSLLRLKNLTEVRKDVVAHLVELERIRWSNRVFLDGLFDEINFSAVKDPEAVGIRISDLGLNLPDRMLFYALHRTSQLRDLLRPALTVIAPKKSIAALLERSGGLFFLQVEENNFPSLFQLGWCFQNLWLEATKLSLGFQPVSPTLIAYNYWQTRNRQIFNDKDRETVESQSTILKDRFNLDTKKYVIGFRVGHQPR